MAHHPGGVALTPEGEGPPTPEGAGQFNFYVIGVYSQLHALRNLALRNDVTEFTEIY